MRKAKASRAHPDSIQSAHALSMLARNGGPCARRARRYATAMPQPAWAAAFLRNGWLIVSRHPARAHGIRVAALWPAHEVVTMSTTDPQAPSKPRTSLWMRELPFTVVLILTILGIAY